MLNEIPKATHELARYFEQPSPDEIVIDEDDSLMTQRAFEKLQEYSLSYPSLLYEGKMWKARGLDGKSWWLYFVTSAQGGYALRSRRIYIWH